MFVEYPKCLYRADETATADSAEHEKALAADGFVTVEVFRAEPAEAAEPVKRGPGRPKKDAE